MAVEVFKTNVPDKEVADKLICDLSLLIPQSKINFDLTDCDRILRIESISDIHIQSIASHMVRCGYACEVLDC